MIILHLKGQKSGESLMIGIPVRQYFFSILYPGSRLTPQIRSEINESHRQHKTYLSTADAEFIKGSSNKADFPETYDPCLAFFRSVVQNEGYWNSSHAELQLEDAVDAISTIFPQFDCVLPVL